MKFGECNDTESAVESKTNGAHIDNMVINKGSKHTQDSKLENENKLPTVENTSVDENIGQDNKSQDVRDKIILTFIKETKQNCFFPGWMVDQNYGNESDSGISDANHDSDQETTDQVDGEKEKNHDDVSDMAESVIPCYRFC